MSFEEETSSGKNGQTLRMMNFEILEIIKFDHQNNSQVVVRKIRSRMTMLLYSTATEGQCIQSTQTANCSLPVRKESSAPILDQVMPASKPNPSTEAAGKASQKNSFCEFFHLSKFQNLQPNRKFESLDHRQR